MENNSLAVKTNKLIDEVQDLMGDYMKVMGVNMFNDMADTDFAIVGKSLKMANTSIELAKAYAEKMDSMDKKMDELIEICKKR